MVTVLQCNVVMFTLGAEAGVFLNVSSCAGDQGLVVAQEAKEGRQGDQGDEGAAGGGGGGGEGGAPF